MRFTLSPLLLAALVSIAATAANAGGGGWLISETWETYCDGTTERVRATFVYHFQYQVGGIEEMGGEMAPRDGSCLVIECGPTNAETITDLGGDLYQFVFQGWERACMSSASTMREGMVLFGFDDGLGISHYIIRLPCSEGERTIIDNADCVALPVAASTWGRVKALYR